jgi:predicted metal-binding protein
MMASAYACARRPSRPFLLSLASPRPRLAEDFVTATLYICDTCRFTPDLREHEGRTGGAIFAEHVERCAEQLQMNALRLLRTSCLMACTRHCTAHLRAPGKIGYIIGDFLPDAANAAALLDYVRKYQQSETGQVPYKTWPPGIKGHFIARTPPDTHAT